MCKFYHSYKYIVSPENLLLAWKEFQRGKKNRTDVILFQSTLSSNLATLYEELKNKTYIHGQYSAFNISDPKPRNIHKASVRDRVLHHLLYKALYPHFEARFIHDSFSCRENKGTHRALNRFRDFALRVSRNNTRQCFVLKCDVKKFFASIDHSILLSILNRHIEDKDIIWLLERIINSFENSSGVGLPLGNLTSQLLVNIYMHEFDMYIKQELRVKYYIRYADDFVVLSQDKAYLELTLDKIKDFLLNKLKLKLHEDKVFIKNFSTGVDFLGWVHFPYHRILRTTTKRRIMRGLSKYTLPESKASYLGILKWGQTYKLKNEILSKIIK